MCLFVAVILLKYMISLSGDDEVVVVVVCLQVQDINML
jgi:hypothetical protein